jgi:hypothetical protein
MPDRCRGRGGLWITFPTGAWGARPRGGEPAKITSDIDPPRTFLAEWVPSTQASASTTFDFPEPLGPTMTVMPGPTSTLVVSAKDLKPLSDRDLRNTLPPAARARLRRHRAA